MNISSTNTTRIEMFTFHVVHKRVYQVRGLSVGPPKVAVITHLQWTEIRVDYNFVTSTFCYIVEDETRLLRPVISP